MVPYFGGVITLYERSYPCASNPSRVISPVESSASETDVSIASGGVPFGITEIITICCFLLFPLSTSKTK